STTREGAVELQVQTGQELTDIDIRYRGDRGHSVSGAVALAQGVGASQVGASVMLFHSATGSLEGQTFIAPDSAARAFSFDGIADGDYDLTASGFAQADSTSAAPVHVSVRGADVAGVRLTLAPLASLAGRVAYEPLGAADAAKPECQQSKRVFVAQELIVRGAREGGDGNSLQRLLAGTLSEASPSSSGEFLLRNLRDGRYRLDARLTDENLYLRSVTLATNATTNAANANPTGATTPTPNPATATPSAAANARASAATVDLARVGVALKPGERAAGALVTVAAGAARLSGRVAAAEGEALPNSLRVYLVPAERERAEDVLRYAETPAREDGSFAFRNLAPGSYLLIARPLTETDTRRDARTPPLLDPTFRAQLRRDAEAAKNAVALQPCERAADFALRLGRQ
ncbi:MAG: hypothetical protein LC746_17335, partial [Acidobacteria bacterium]|nr:hypothetical protein [Acidobacteriota bacterium]